MIGFTEKRSDQYSLIGSMKAKAVAQTSRCVSRRPHELILNDFSGTLYVTNGNNIGYISAFEHVLTCIRIPRFESFGEAHSVLLVTSSVAILNTGNRIFYWEQTDKR